MSFDPEKTINAWLEDADTYLKGLKTLMARARETQDEEVYDALIKSIHERREWVVEALDNAAAISGEIQYQTHG